MLRPSPSRYQSVPGAIAHYAFGQLTVPWHRHDSLQFNLVSRGCASFLVGDRSYRLERGTGLWVFPNQDHILLDSTRDFAMWFGYFPPDLVRRACRSPDSEPLLGVAPPAHPARDFSGTSLRRLEQLFREIGVDIKDSARYQAALAYGLLTAWEHFRRSSSATLGIDIHPSVERATQLLRREDSPENLAALARECGISTSRLSRLFHEQLGVTIPEFRNRHRVDRFISIFGEGRRHSLTEAALLAGFTSYSQFHRAFKKITDIGPAAYRRNIRGEV